MKRWMFLACGSVLLAAAGCRVPCIDYQANITSEPPGVRIEINEDVVGTTPCTVTICALRERLFRVHSAIKAYPVDPNQDIQVKFFRRRTLIPYNLHFEMAKRPGGPGFDSKPPARRSRE